MCMFEILKKKINYFIKTNCEKNKQNFLTQQLIDIPFNKFEKSNQIMKQLLVCIDCNVKIYFVYLLLVTKIG